MASTKRFCSSRVLVSALIPAFESSSSLRLARRSSSSDSNLAISEWFFSSSASSWDVNSTVSRFTRSSSWVRDSRVCGDD